ncbi:MAG: ATP synthase F1 subunit delta [Chloroflexi bacterium]|nr:ATP synthase F1 subunit delta [Chloroflexota bacterium]
MASKVSARRYAQAVFALATERGEGERWRQDVADIAAAFGEPRMAQVLESPKVPYARKMQLIRASLGDLPTLALNLAFLMAYRGLVPYAGQVWEEFERLYNASQGIALARVTTAVALSPDELNRLAQRLSQSLALQVRLTAQVDPAIIGGLVVRIEDKLLDGSVRSLLRSLREELVGR